MDQSSQKKVEIIMKLLQKVERLQHRLQGWTEWASRKIMQAAQTLSKDKEELQTLRREKQIEEEDTKVLSQLENEVHKLTEIAEQANANLEIVEEENNELKNRMEDATIQAMMSEDKCAEALDKEKETAKLFQSSRMEKTLLQNELAFDKQKSAWIQQQIEQAINLRNKLESKRDLEKSANEELLIQAISLRKERQQIEASAMSKEELYKLKAQGSLQKYKDNIEILKVEIFQIQLKTGTSRIVASEKGIDESYDTTSTYNKSSKLPMQAKENSVIEGVKRERECVMCLSAEKCVVFLPCGHQAVCKTCNSIHEKQGLTDCPSCRTPIQKRICVRYARP